MKNLHHIIPVSSSSVTSSIVLFVRPMTQMKEKQQMIFLEKLEQRMFGVFAEKMTKNN